MSAGGEASGMHGRPSVLKSALFANVFGAADVVNIILLLTYVLQLMLFLSFTAVL